MAMRTKCKILKKHFIELMAIVIYDFNYISLLNWMRCIIANRNRYSNIIEFTAGYYINDYFRSVVECHQLFILAIFLNNQCHMFPGESRHCLLRVINEFIWNMSIFMKEIFVQWECANIAFIVTVQWNSTAS